MTPRFPLKEWIDSHAGLRHDLSASGMRGSLRALPASRSRFDHDALSRLEEALARSLGVDPARVFPTHGATEANAVVVGFLAHRARGGARVGRVCLPEYPPLVDLLRAHGYRKERKEGGADLAIVSRPRNPEGDLWPKHRLSAWAEGARALLVDETFREFAGTPSVAVSADHGVWASGTFTKFFGADHLRVGFVVAPPEEVEEFRRFYGLVVDELPPASAVGALQLLERREVVRRKVRRLLATNLASLERLDRRAPRPVGPVFFDRSAPDGDALADAGLRSGVLVCPGRFFGEPAGVRVGLTRRNFPRDLSAYLAVRAALSRPEYG